MESFVERFMIEADRFQTRAMDIKETNKKI